MGVGGREGERGGREREEGGALTKTRIKKEREREQRISWPAYSARSSIRSSRYCIRTGSFFGYFSPCFHFPSSRFINIYCTYQEISCTYRPTLPTNRIFPRSTPPTVSRQSPPTPLPRLRLTSRPRSSASRLKATLCRLLARLHTPRLCFCTPTS